jgi:pyruvate/2-oxoglutarate dehydrogenase complex dihydrolipoamide acyltransferase (E2) component
MRRTIGEHMKRSLNEAATVTSWIEVDFGAVEERRRELGVTALPVVAEATMRTLAEFGELNAWLEGDEHTLHSEVNLGIAVSLGAEGLIVPVVRGAQRLGVAELGERIAELAARARSGTLSPDDVRDGTFTITNPGQFGTFMATPVINQPQVAILDIESIVRRPVVVEVDGVEQIAIRPVCVLGLSWDHRALDGVVAAQFLGALRDRLQSA